MNSSNIFDIISTLSIVISVKWIIRKIWAVPKYLATIVTPASFYRAKIKPEVVDNRDISQSLSGTVFAPCLFAQSIISRKRIEIQRLDEPFVSFRPFPFHLPSSPPLSIFIHSNFEHGMIELAVKYCTEKYNGTTFMRVVEFEKKGKKIIGSNWNRNKS